MWTLWASHKLLSAFNSLTFFVWHMWGDLYFWGPTPESSQVASRHWAMVGIVTIPLGNQRWRQIHAGPQSKSRQWPNNIKSLPGNGLYDYDLVEIGKLSTVRHRPDAVQFAPARPFFLYTGWNIERLTIEFVIIANYWKMYYSECFFK